MFFERKHKLTTPEFGVAVATRAALGAGIGLILSGKLPSKVRQRLGVALVALGAITTIPIVRRLRA